jgi:hypothetical protein
MVRDRLRRQSVLALRSDVPVEELRSRLDARERHVGTERREDVPAEGVRVVEDRRPPSAA